MRGSWKALVYLIFAFEIPLLTLAGYFVGKQIDLLLGMPDANIFVGLGIIGGLYVCWLTFGKFRDFVEQRDDQEEDDA